MSLANDILLADGPEDSVSALSFSPIANHLAVASWDSKLRIYDLSQIQTGQGKALVAFDGPVLSCDWSADGHGVVAAGADKTARLLDLGSNGAPAQQVAKHDEPIRAVRFFQAPASNAPMIVTGSWDKTLKYWDLRQPAAIASLTCKERVYSMDVQKRLLVAATADRHIHVVGLDNPTVFERTIQSPLRFQTRVVSCFTEATGFAVGSIEGRCAFQYLRDTDSSKNFTFKCHRDAPKSNNVDVYAVNDISFHPVYGTFSTAGSDGSYHFWDREAHMRLKAFPPVGGSITSTAFNRDGTIFAYAVGYDWSKGYSYNTPQFPCKVMLHPIIGDECKERAPTRRR